MKAQTLDFQIDSGQGWELRHGRWQDVLRDVPADTLITDPPYSARTHDSIAGVDRREHAYTAIGAGDISDLVSSTHNLIRGWRVIITDHILAPTVESAYTEAGLYAFSPIACVTPGRNVRLLGDGPAQWSVWALMARPRRSPYSEWGALPGAYIQPSGHADDTRYAPITGVKSLWLMRVLIRHYSRPGDTIIDPYAGTGTTLLAAVTEGRRAIGAEVDADTYAYAVRRLARGWTPTLGLEDTP